MFNMVIQSTQFYFIFNVAGQSKNRYYVWIKFLKLQYDGKRVRIHSYILIQNWIQIYINLLKFFLLLLNNFMIYVKNMMNVFTL